MTEFRVRDADAATPSDAALAERAQAVHRLAREQGFALVGIAPAAATSRDDYLRRWLADGQHGEMAYLARNVETRTDPAALLPGARAVICVADWYGGDDDGDDDSDASPSRDDAPAGRIARYAWGDDYHLIMKKRLHALADALREAYPGHEYRACVDTAPILEREHAARAGLGWVGKHTLLIHPRYGSWFLLGEIVTTLELATNEQAALRDEASREDEVPAPPAHPGHPAALTDHCGTCTRCIDACPTHCIEPYQLDASRCISYLTLEHRTAIDPALHEAMGDWIAGCDVCQDVCPHNTHNTRTNAHRLAVGPQGHLSPRQSHPPQLPPAPPRHPRYTPRPPAPAIPLLELLNWTADDRRDAFRASALKRIKLDMLKRNALIAAGNYLIAQDDDALGAGIVSLASDAHESELVRVTAQQVLARLSAH